MRVLVTTPDFPPDKGGIQLLVRQLVEHLRPFSVSVVALAAPDDESVDRSLRCSVHRVQRAGDHRASIGMLNARTVREAVRYRPDVIISAHIVTGPGALAAGAVLRVPTVQYTHAKELGTRGRLARSVLSRADAVIAVSAHTARGARDRGARADRIHIIHPGIDAPPPDTDTPRDPMILTVARLEDRYKGFDVLLRALPLVIARVPSVCWTVVGDGPLRAELEGTARRWGLGEHVRFTGPIDDDPRDALLARAAVFAMPSRTPSRGVGGEGFGIVYLEAGRFGVPVVAGAAGGAVDAVLDGETGILVDPRDHVAVADAIADLLVDPEHARRLGDAGRRHAAELSWARMGREVRELLVRLTAG
jgi:phosphatidylinositol alpha-1,6-mannosyltransferase